MDLCGRPQKNKEVMIWKCKGATFLSAIKCRRQSLGDFDFYGLPDFILC